MGGWGGGAGRPHRHAGMRPRPSGGRRVTWGTGARGRGPRLACPTPPTVSRPHQRPFIQRWCQPCAATPAAATAQAARSVGHRLRRVPHYPPWRACRGGGRERRGGNGEAGAGGRAGAEGEEWGGGSGKALGGERGREGRGGVGGIWGRGEGTIVAFRVSRDPLPASRGGGRHTIHCQPRQEAYGVRASPAGVWKRRWRGAAATVAARGRDGAPAWRAGVARGRGGQQQGGQPGTVGASTRVYIHGEERQPPPLAGSNSNDPRPQPLTRLAPRASLYSPPSPVPTSARC